ncbi:MAG TPA: hypothetical protein VFP36_02920 [Usitatibacter sp.]|nr:hypothetical protein [Usitatibacter sp.]
MDGLLPGDDLGARIQEPNADHERRLGELRSLEGRGGALGIDPRVGVHFLPRREHAADAGEDGLQR